MYLSEIRYRLHHNFQLAVLSGMGVMALVFIMPFAAYRVLQADWVMVVADSILISAILATLIYAWCTGDARRPCQCLMYFNCFGGVVATLLLGQSILFWMYPMLVSNFFLADRRQAAGGSLFFLVALLVDGRTFPNVLVGVSFVTTGCLVCLYTYIFAYRAELQRQQLEMLVSRDTLTGAFNRRMFQQELAVAHSSFLRNMTTCGLLILDLDYFKQVNDTWGHDAGDSVLIHFARLVERSIRRTDRFFRFGGEEFVVLVYATSLESLVVMANGICQRVRDELVHEGKFLTVSIGGALLDFGESAEAWFARADAALYRAKNQGRDQVVMDGRNAGS